METPATLSQAYKLDPGTSQVNIKLITAGAYFIQHGSTNQENEISYGQIGTASDPLSFTVYSSDTYLLALVETQYGPVTLPGGATVNPPSYCHIYFKLGSTDWFWATDAQTADNVTIFARGSGQSTSTDIKIQSPTAINPNGIVSEYPALNSDLVFLLDKNSNGNMLFRGNEPLKAGISSQSVDFAQLHQVLQTKYNLQTGLNDFPAIGSYILRDIAFLNASGDELDILTAEISSFGATSASQVDQQWYPAAPPFANPLAGGMIGQVANWNVEQGSANVAFDVQVAKSLSTWMDTQEQNASGTDIPTIYYIHCSSGHDRTGMMASAYLMQHYSLDVSDAFILGTTILKPSIPIGGSVVQDCCDITSGLVDPLRSRCFVAGDGGTDSPYNDTVIDIANTIFKVTDSAFNTYAVSGDPEIDQSGNAYVHSYYAWDIPAARSAVSGTAEEETLAV